MKLDFKGTSEDWAYREPTDRFDACTVSKSGKIIGFCTKDSIEDRANEKLRAAALDLLNSLLDITGNIENWIESGVPADAQKSENLYNNAKSAIDKALL